MKKIILAVLFTTQLAFSQNLDFTSAQVNNLLHKIDAVNENIYSDTLALSWSIGLGNSAIDTITTGTFWLGKIPNNYTATEIAACTNTGTITFNINKRAETTPNTTGTDIMTSSLVADSDQQETSSFSSATITRNQWLALSIISITGDPTMFSGSIRYIKTN